MKKRIALYTILITAVCLVIFFVSGLIDTQNNNYEVTEKNIKNYAKIYAQNYVEDKDYIKEVSQDIRVTIIKSDGDVLFDSKAIDTASMGNHLSREEIQSALKGLDKVTVRDSESIKKKLMYYAVKKDVKDSFVFIRVAMPITSISSYVENSVIVYSIVFISISALAILSSFLMAKKVLKPFEMVKESLKAINDDSYVKILPTSNYPEINVLLSEINDISEKTNDNIAKIKEQFLKLDFLNSNISDGVFAIDNDSNIILLNESAKRIFGIERDITGKNILYLSSNRKLNKEINKSLEENINSIFEIEIEEKGYLVSIKKLSDNWQNDGKDIAVIIMTDISVVKDNEKIRSEFFDNCSHELKTPLTTIKGFGELLQQNIQDENYKNQIDQIVKQSNIMIGLIDDMLKLSNLENSKDNILEEVDLVKITSEVFENLDALAKEKEVKLNLSGEGVILANSSHIYDLIRNLVENGIKYNKEKGEVKVDIAKTERRTILEVTDTGIGIDDKYQSRIFERFFRIEKSRSRKMGGTGLGLAIVKHICGIYEADLTLQSKMRIGTKITIKFKSGTTAST